jgi:hypothetical protein
MKIPKRVLLAGVHYSIKIDKNKNGASFNCAKKEIWIGTKDPNEIEENFIHEVCECILAIRDYRYIPQKAEISNNDYIFNFNHKEFESFIRDLTIALKGISFNKSGDKKK